MNITKKSVNAALARKQYFQQYRLLGQCGLTPDGSIGTLEKVVADVMDDGTIRITDYAYGEAQKQDHYYGKCTDITDIITDWIQSSEITRKYVVNEIVENLRNDSNHSK